MGFDDGIIFVLAFSWRWINFYDWHGCMNLFSFPREGFFFADYFLNYFFSFFPVSRLLNSESELVMRKTNVKDARTFCSHLANVLFVLCV